MSKYIYRNGELFHYGVPGMKWGKRKAQRQELKEAKRNYKDAKNKAFSEYEKSINDIEKKYKRVQNLSEADFAKELAVEKKYKDTVDKAKADFKTVKQKVKAEKAIDQANKSIAKTLISGAVSSIGMKSLGNFTGNLLARKGKSTAAEVVWKIGNLTSQAIAYGSLASAVSTRHLRKGMRRAGINYKSASVK